MQTVILMMGYTTGYVRETILGFGKHGGKLAMRHVT